MKTNYSVLITLAIFFVSACTGTETKSIISNDAELILLSDDFSFTEGPTADSKGNVFFTDQPNNKIYKYGIDESLEVFMENSGRSNGMYFDQNDILWACADEFNQLWKIGPDKKVTVVLNPDSAIIFNGPNDVWVHKNGHVYFTDPLYQRPYWTKPHDTLTYKGLYTLNDNEEAVLADSTLVQPNGIIGDSKNNLLYVADIGAGKTYRYDIEGEGELINRKVFTEMGSDGMALDNEGNLYLTGKGVDVFNDKGEHIHHLDVPENWTANICFGGPNLDELFITASKSLYKITTNVKGID